jgi:hypothetical protein
MSSEGQLRGEQAQVLGRGLVTPHLLSNTKFESWTAVSKLEVVE